MSAVIKICESHRKDFRDQKWIVRQLPGVNKCDRCGDKATHTVRSVDESTIQPINE